MTPDIGHNQPPYADQLAVKYEDLVVAVDKLIKDPAPAKVDDENVEQCVERVMILRTVAKRIDEDRKSEKEPHLEAGRTVDAFFQGLLVQVNRAAGKITEAIGDYQKEVEAHRRRVAAERARREEEEAARRLQEAADSDNRILSQIQMDEAERAAGRSAAAENAALRPDRDMKRVETTAGTVSTRTVLEPLVEDPRAAIADPALHPYFAVADIEKAVRQYMRANGKNGKLAGVRFVETTKTAVR